VVSFSLGLGTKKNLPAVMSATLMNWSRETATGAPTPAPSASNISMPSLARVVTCTRFRLLGAGLSSTSAKPSVKSARVKT
jgi:hypothetical protein